jgi:hypothetical protein
MIEEAKDLVVLRQPWRTVRDPAADGPRSPGGRSATHGRTVRQSQQNDQMSTQPCGWSLPGPQTVRDLWADGLALTRTVRDPYADGPTNSFRPEPDDQMNQSEDAQEHATKTKNPRPKSSARTVCGL